MRILITGSAGHLGRALYLTLMRLGHTPVGLDVLPAPTTSVVGSIGDTATLVAAMQGVDAVIHTATLHKPHVDTHSRQAFVDVNISGTLTLLECAARVNVRAFIFTSTTSTFGNALRPPPDQPAAWITEAVVPAAKNIYGATKVAAETLCELFHRDTGMPIIVLRTSRFFPESDDDPLRRSGMSDLNLKVVELLYRRVDIADAVTAHLAAIARAPTLGFGRYIVSATSPFEQTDLARLRGRAAEVLAERFPAYPDIFTRAGFRMLDDIDRIYVNDHAREALGWQPQHTFGFALNAIAKGESPFSELTEQIGVPGYHRGTPIKGIYPFAAETIEGIA
jgi:UDP-glucose 4-epimerase